MGWLRFQGHAWQSAVGMLLCMAGAVVLTALWAPALQLETIARFFPPNTALGFVLLGVSLINPRPSLSIACALATLAIGVVVSWQYVFGVDLHVDQLIAHVWFDAPSPYPGRMSPQAAVCFIGCALALLVWYTPFAMRAATLAQVLALCLTAFATVSLIGYCFDLEVLYRWYGNTRLSPYAAALFVLVGVTLWMKWYRRAIDAGRFDRHEDKRIKLVANSLIVMVAAVAGASGFVLLAARSEDASRVALMQTLSSRIGLLEMQLEERLRAIDRLAAQLDSPEGAALVRRTSLQSLLGQEFSAIRWQAADGTTQVAGRFLERPHAALDVDGATRLLWRNEAVLHVEHVGSSGSATMHLSVEAPLTALTAMLQLQMQTQKTAAQAAFVCAPRGAQVRCLPEQLITSAKSGSLDSSELSRLVQQVHERQRGTQTLLSRQGRPLIAAFAPLAHGLASVLQQDADEVYAGLRQARLRLAIALAMVIIVGILLLRSQLGPLARRASEARAAAVESGTRTEAIMNSVADGILTFDAAGAIVAANPALFAMFGYGAGELIGQSVDRLISDGLQTTRDQGWVRYVRDNPAAQGERTVEVMGRRRDGSTFAAQLTLTAMQLGGATYLVGNVRDVTLAKFAEAQLRRANERFKLATQAARLGVFEWDLGSGVLIWDPIVHELHHVPLDSTPTYDTWRRLVHPDDLSRLEQEVSDAIAVGRDMAFEFRIVLPDCSERALRTAATIARDALGTPMRVTGVTWDVTEGRRLDRMKSEFVSVVSHELRTPLTSIRGALGLIAGTAASLPEKTRRLFDIAYRNTDRLALLISDILDVEKIEFGALAFNNELLNVRHLVEQAIENNQPYAVERGVRLQLVTSNEDIFVVADANRLLQVMANLLSNAAKFSPAGTPVDIAILPLPSSVRISVRDYGPGIPESFQPRVFQKFAQADASDTRAKGGTGLGLAICKAIVERLGGRIAYDSGPGVGTLFYFDLPLAQDMTESGVWRHRPTGSDTRTEAL